MVDRPAPVLKHYSSCRERIESVPAARAHRWAPPILGWYAECSSAALPSLSAAATPSCNKLWMPHLSELYAHCAGPRLGEHLPVEDPAAAAANRFATAGGTGHVESPACALHLMCGGRRGRHQGRKGHCKRKRPGAMTLRLRVPRDPRCCRPGCRFAPQKRARVGPRAG